MPTPEYPARLEEVLDAIAEALIDSDIVNKDELYANQKTIRNGLISLGRTNADKLVLFEKDIKANKEDLQLSDDVNDDGQMDTLISAVLAIEENPFEIEVTTGPNTFYLKCDSIGMIWNITNLLTVTDVTGTLTNPINVSQFINVEEISTQVDSSQANEFLDTNIFELLPQSETRQQRIDRFFEEFYFLLGDPGIPVFDNWDEDPYDIIEAQPGYEEEHDIGYAQEQGLPQEDKFITRLEEDADAAGHPNQSIQFMRDTLTQYLEDVDQSLAIPEDVRPEYKNKSDGYLKFRKLNQGIIIRNTTDDFVNNLNPNTREYLTTGFTIAMWVRFLDKKSEGTLFNFGNPTREQNPLGFKFETLVDEANEKRYLRLLVYDNDASGVEQYAYYDSHTGINGIDKINTITGGSFEANLLSLDSIDKSQYTEIPLDFNEWFFVVATFNPDVSETTSFGQTFSSCEFGSTCEQDPFYWNGYIDMAGYTHYSGFGNKCKVEYISRSDLLRARGYKI